MKGILYAIAIACAIYAGAGDLFAATPVYRDYSVSVVQGDTLWDIACRHAEGKEDVRLVMERIAKANKLDVGHIYHHLNEFLFDYMIILVVNFVNRV